MKQGLIMQQNKARVISNWKPTNQREAAAMKELLMQEMGVTERLHPGGTGKLAQNNGRLIR